MMKRDMEYLAHPGVQAGGVNNLGEKSGGVAGSQIGVHADLRACRNAAEYHRISTPRPTALRTPSGVHAAAPTTPSNKLGGVAGGLTEAFITL